MAESDARKIQVHADWPKAILKVQLEQKYMVENFLSDPGERSAFFVVSWIKVYIIIIMGHL